MVSSVQALQRGLQAISGLVILQLSLKSRPQLIMSSYPGKLYLINCAAHILVCLLQVI